MKRGQVLCLLALALNFGLAGIYWFLLPDKIPGHYNLQGEVTRWGNKAELFILPMCGLLLGLGVLLSSRMKEFRQSEAASHAFWRVSWLSMLFLACFTGVIGLAGLAPTIGISLPFELSQMVFSLLGLFLFGVGSSLKGLAKNPVMGVRTPWTMKNEDNWQVGQALGSKWFKLIGLVLFVTSLLIKASWAWGFHLGVFLLGMMGLLIQLNQVKAGSVKEE